MKILTGEEIKNLPLGKTFWYGYISFREKTFRCNSILKPIEVRIELNTYDSYYKTIVSIVSVKDGKHIDSFSSVRKSTDPECKFYIMFFDTEEECKEYYNASVHNTIDRLQHFYEEKLKYIKSKLI